jgi:hypothetical protein
MTMRPISTLLCSALLLVSGAASAQEAAAVQEVAAPAPAPVAEAAMPAAETPAPLDRSTLKYSNKWRITFNHEAKNDGTLVFRMVMKNSDAEPVVVSIPISKGTGENSAARKVKGALQSAFPRDFNVETDDNESVLVKLNLIEGDSNVTLVSSDVEGLKIKIKKE